MQIALTRSLLLLEKKHFWLPSQKCVDSHSLLLSGEKKKSLSHRYIDLRSLMQPQPRILYFAAHPAAASSLRAYCYRRFELGLDVQQCAEQVRYKVVKMYRYCHANVTRQNCSCFATVANLSSNQFGTLLRRRATVSGQ